jgi:hypothetical protein
MDDIQEKLRTHVAADLKHAAVDAANMETLLRIEQQLRQIQQQTKPLRLIVVADRAVLRAGPSSDSRRVGVVKPGTIVEETLRYKRWSYVEVLAPDASRADGVRGWVYRRTTRQK